MKVPPAVDQIETHPFHQQMEAQQFMAENKVQMGSWGPLAEGKNDLFHNAVLAGIGTAHGKSVAQVVIRWLTQRGVNIGRSNPRWRRVRSARPLREFVWY